MKKVKLIVRDSISRTLTQIIKSAPSEYDFIIESGDSRRYQNFRVYVTEPIQFEMNWNHFVTEFKKGRKGELFKKISGAVATLQANEEVCQDQTADDAVGQAATDDHTKKLLDDTATWLTDKDSDKHKDNEQPSLSQDPESDESEGAVLVKQPDFVAPCAIELIDIPAKDIYKKVFLAGIKDRIAMVKAQSADVREGLPILSAKLNRLEGLIDMLTGEDGHIEDYGVQTSLALIFISNTAESLFLITPEERFLGGMDDV